MLTEKCLKNGTAALGLLLTACTSGLSASSTPAVAASSGSLGGSIVDVVPTTAGNYDDGYQLGLRNGEILVGRLRKRTVDIAGCSAVDQLQAALIKVVRSARPPSHDSDEYVAGFYTGYIDSIRGAVSEVRYTCDESQYSSGDFAGQLYGEVACQVASISASAISYLQFQPLYSGWSGGSSSVQSGCRTTLLATLQSCSTGTDIAATINATVSVSCSDSFAL